MHSYAKLRLLSAPRIGFMKPIATSSAHLRTLDPAGLTVKRRDGSAIDKQLLR